MSQQFATGKNAIAICDRCGLQFDYKELRTQIVNMVDTGLLVCSECLDQDHPQYQVGMWPIDDPQALRDPRPSDNSDRGLYGWSPIQGCQADGAVGQVRIT